MFSFRYHSKRHIGLSGFRLTGFYISNIPSIYATGLHDCLFSSYRNKRIGLLLINSLGNYFRYVYLIDFIITTLSHSTKNNRASKTSFLVNSKLDKYLLPERHLSLMWTYNYTRKSKWLSIYKNFSIFK